MTPVNWQEQGANRYRVSGELGFETVTALLAHSRRAFDGSSGIEIDLSGVTQSDSAGLALLIEWSRLAFRAGIELTYTDVPGQLRALARISEVEEILGLAGPSAG